MYAARRIALGLLAAAAVAHAADPVSDVTQLNKDTFNDFVKDHEIVLAECKPHPPKNWDRFPLVRS